MHFMLLGANNIIRTINQLISNFKSDIKEAKHLKAQQVQHLVSNYFQGNQQLTV